MPADLCKEIQHTVDPGHYMSISYHLSQFFLQLSQTVARNVKKLPDLAHFMTHNFSCSTQRAAD